MKIAVDLDGNFILAEDALNEKKYICPRCSKELLICRGESCIPYFRHANTCKKKNEGGSESILHKDVKRQITAMFKRIGIEAFSEYVQKDIGRRIDVFVKDKAVKLAVEIQCSPITLEEIIQRKHDYNSIGIRSWWIAGPNHLTPRSLKSTAVKFGKTTKFGKSFFGVDQHEKYWLYSNFRITAMGKSLYQRRRIELDWNNIVEWRQIETKDTNFFQTSNLIDDVNWIKKCLFGKHLNIKFISFQKELYEKHKTLEGSPWISHFPREVLAMNKNDIPFLKRIELIQFLENAAPNQQITMSPDDNGLFKHILIRTGYIKMIDKCIYRTEKNFKWYSDSMEKIKDVHEISLLMRHENELKLMRGKYAKK